MEDRLEQLEKRMEKIERIVGTKLSQEQARKYIGVASRATMQKYVRLGLLHPYRKGNRLYYNITELNRFCS